MSPHVIRYFLRWSLAAAMCGIAIGYAVPIADPLFFLLAACVGIFVAITADGIQYRIGIVIVSIFFLGCFRTALDRQWETYAVPRDANSHHVEGRVVSDPRIQGDFFSAIIAPDTIDAVPAFGVRVRVTAPSDTRIRNGDSVRVRCILTLPTEKSAFIRRHHIGYACDTHTIEKEDSQTFASVISTMRTRSESLVSRYFSQPVAGFLGGLLFGGNGLPVRETAEFRITGLSHIIAVSGSNIALVMIFFESLLTAWWVPRRIRGAIALIGIGFFTLFTGASAATVRAACMAGIVVVARMTGRKSSGLDLLFYAAALLVVAAPTLLLFDIGFQLSLAATAGLMIGSVPIEKLFLRIKHDSFRSLLSQTIAAQLFTIPIIIGYFGNLSLIGFFANLVIVPLIPWTMLVGAAWFAIAVPLSMIGVFATPIISLIGIPIDFILRELLALVHIFAGVPGASVTILTTSARILFVILWIGYLSFFMWKYRSRTNERQPLNRARSVL